MDDVLKGINDEFGEGTAFRMGKVRPLKIPVISTGSFSLDMALGVGGLPRGRIIEIYGPESSGKTSLALSVCAQAQKLGGEVIYIDAEHALDLEYAEKLGVDIVNLVMSQPNSAEEALNLVQRFVESESVAVIVVDSVAALTPNAENENDMGAPPMAMQARLMSQAMRKLVGIVSKTNTMLIFINQIRMNLAMRGYGSPETTTGGKALKFYASVRIDVRRIGKLKEGEEFVGNSIRAKIVKNKVAAPFKQAEFYLMFDSGISYEADIFNTAVKCKVIEKKASTYFFEDEKLGVGAKNATGALKENRELLEKVKAMILKAEPIVKTHDDEEEN